MSHTRRIVFSLVLAGLFDARAADVPRTFGFRADALVAARSRAAKGDAGLMISLAQLRAEADKLLKLKPASVMDKKRTAASGDHHDYFSLGTYWWPDPSKPDGLPYIRRDGEVNPEIRNDADFVPFSTTCKAVETLGLAYWFTGDERYAQKVAKLLRVWFLDPATRMNPNLQHAQAIPGSCDGRGIGIIEAHFLIGLTDGLALIDGSPVWPASDATSMNAWFADYYHWLTTSKNGLDEAATENNHGSWYDAQAADLALVLGKTDEAKKILSEFPTKRIARQIEPDGRQPRELERTNSLRYSIFNLEALFTLSRLGENVGVDAWNFATPDGRGLRAALRFLAPYADPAKAWPKEDIEAPARTTILPFLAEALSHGDDAQLREPLEKFSGQPASGEYWRLWWTGKP